MSRLNLLYSLGSVLQIAKGATVELPAKLHRILDECTNPTWPTTWFMPRLTGRWPLCDVYSVMSNWRADPGAFS